MYLRQLLCVDLRRVKPENDVEIANVVFCA